MTGPTNHAIWRDGLKALVRCLSPCMSSPPSGSGRRRSGMARRNEHGSTRLRKSAPRATGIRRRWPGIAVTARRPAFADTRRGRRFRPASELSAAGREISKLAKSAAELARTTPPHRPEFFKKSAAIPHWTLDAASFSKRVSLLFFRSEMHFANLSRAAKKFDCIRRAAGAGVRGILGERSSINDDEELRRLTL